MMAIVAEEFAAAMRSVGLQPSARVSLALSGGVDSMALALLASRYLTTPPSTITIDHRMRPESTTEAAWV